MFWSNFIRSSFKVFIPRAFDASIILKFLCIQVSWESFQWKLLLKSLQLFFSPESLLPSANPQHKSTAFITSPRFICRVQISFLSLQCHRKSPLSHCQALIPMLCRWTKLISIIMSNCLLEKRRGHSSSSIEACDECVMAHERSICCELCSRD